MLGTNLFAASLLTFAWFGDCRIISTEDVVRIRCDLAGGESITRWEGKVLAFIPQQQPAHLFDFVGFNINRCFKNDVGTWQSVSRELSYYIDPTTGAKLNQWPNPFTNRTTTVVHVANDPVNSNEVSPLEVVDINNDTFAMSIDVPLFYPNPLSNNATLFKYAPFKWYEAGEFFKFYVSNDRFNENSTSVRNVAISWSRAGPWLPWMDMGDTPGGLQFTVVGGKQTNFDGLPEWVLDELHLRVPLYLHAPASYEIPNETSYTYFAKHFREFLRGDEFPIPVAGNRWNQTMS